MTFSSDIKKWADRTLRKVEDVSVAVRIDVSSDIIGRTPVDEGTLRGAWIPTIESPNLKGTGRPDKTGERTLTRVQQKAIEKPFGVFYLTNNMPYAYRVEYEGHSHTKAPEGMLRISVRNFKKTLKKAVK